MKITGIDFDNLKKQFLITTSETLFTFPYGKSYCVPSRDNPIKKIWIDEDFGGDAFSYMLHDGQDGTVHMDHILEYNRDPNYMTELLLYKLTIEAKRHLKQGQMSNREIIRRLGTSASQYYRLLDQTNTAKSINKMLNLLQVLGCEVDVVFKDHEQNSEQVLISI